MLNNLREAHSKRYTQKYSPIKAATQEVPARTNVHLSVGKSRKQITVWGEVTFLWNVIVEDFNILLLELL